MHSPIMAPGGPKEPEVWLPPFQVGPRQRMGIRQRALHGRRATAPTSHLIKEDSDLGLLPVSDSVHCDNVSGNVSCLNVHAPVFQPVSVFNECFVVF